jgi:hypothetical protein
MMRMLWCLVVGPSHSWQDVLSWVERGLCLDPLCWGVRGSCQLCYQTQVAREVTDCRVSA